MLILEIFTGYTSLFEDCLRIYNSHKKLDASAEMENISHLSVS